MEGKSNTRSFQCSLLSLFALLTALSIMIGFSDWLFAWLGILPFLLGFVVGSAKVQCLAAHRSLASFTSLFRSVGHWFVAPTTGLRGISLFLCLCKVPSLITRFFDNVAIALNQFVEIFPIGMLRARMSLASVACPNSEKIRHEVPRAKPIGELLAMLIGGTLQGAKYRKKRLRLLPAAHR